MFLETLSVQNFKNCLSRQFEFSKALNCIIGANGIGKTNILDAIYYTSFCKSYFSHSDSQCINDSAEYFSIESEYRKNEVSNTILFSYNNEKKKSVKVNGKKYKKLAEHIGQYPSIMITPSDSVLVDGSSVERRRFIDIFISQLDPEYLHYLIKYNRLLEQRNKLLKEPNAYSQKDTFEILDMQLVVAAQYIYNARIKALEELRPLFSVFYEIISGGKEVVSVDYKASCDYSNFEEELQNSLNKDFILKHTTVGIHRDDLTFNLKSHLLKQAGSQGQKKTFLLALKFAKYQATYNKTGIKPLLLLDDLFDKLDKNRVNAIIELVSGEDFGQIFITDTDRDSVQSVLDEFSGKSTIISL